jgi:hypothetical protein
VSSHWVISHLGTDYVVIGGLLLEAHQRGVTAITSSILQVPSPQNGSRAICRAQVTTKNGIFTALGDAYPGNASRSDVSTLLRLAAVRAKGHALCDALNLPWTPIEDLPTYRPAL